MKYVSDKSKWLIGFIWIVCLVMIVGTLSLIIWDAHYWAERIILFFIGFGTSGICLWLTFSTYYVLEEEELVIAFGPFRKRVRYNDIRRITPSSSPVSSPALSLKRVEILYGSIGLVYISPVNRDQFIEELTKRCTSLS